MLRRLLKSTGPIILNRYNGRRNLSTSGVLYSRLTIMGMGGVGQALSIMMKINPLVSIMHLYDEKAVDGFATDLSHIDRMSTVRAFHGKKKMDEALACSDIVVIAAGAVRTDSTHTRDTLMAKNAAIVGEIIDAAAIQCPKAFILIVTNPVNSLVPMAAEILKKHKVYDPKRLFGHSILDTVRTKSFLGDILIRNPQRINVPVIGGHSPETIVPVLSQSSPMLNLEQEILNEVIARVRLGGELVIKAKENKGSAQLCAAYAAKLVCDALLAALINHPATKTIAFVASNLTKSPFFSSSFTLNDTGIKELDPLPALSNSEEDNLHQALMCLEEDIKKGIEASKNLKLTDSNKKC